MRRKQGQSEQLHHFPPIENTISSSAPLSLGLARLPLAQLAVDRLKLRQVLLGKGAREDAVLEAQNSTAPIFGIHSEVVCLSLQAEAVTLEDFLAVLSLAAKTIEELGSDIDSSQILDVLL